MGWESRSPLALARPPRCAPRLDELGKNVAVEGRPKGPLTGVRGSVLARWWIASGVDGNRVAVDEKCEIALARRGGGLEAAKNRPPE
jgi:hypothetical protein